MRRSLPIYAVTALVLAVAGVWALAAPVAYPSTYAATLVVLVAAGIVTWFTWRNALPTDTVAHVLYQTENDASKRTRL